MSPTRRRLVFALKSVFALVVIAAVGWHFAKLLDSPEWSGRELHFQWEHLLAAGVLYLLAHTLWGTFFYQLLRFEGANVSWLVGVRAYFVSQFGKYVPGKAWVILLRIGLLRKHRVSSTAVAVCGTYETLTTMAAGAVLGVCLFPWLGLSDLPQKAGSGPSLRFAFGSWEWVVLAAVGGMPLVLGVLNRRIMKKLSARRGPDAPALPCPSLLLLLRGLLQASLGWGFLGLSLWFTLNAVSPQPIPLSAEGFAESIAAVCVSYVAGFVAIVLPGGLGLRELILQRVLVKQLVPIVGAAASPLSAVVAVTLRLVWTIFEVVAAVSLYVFAKPRPHADSTQSGLSNLDEIHP